MKINKIALIIFAVLACGGAYAQKPSVKDTATINLVKKTTPKKPSTLSRLRITAGLGVASYFGDLTENNKLFNQPGFSFSAGLSYELVTHLNARFDIGVQQVHAADSKNSGAGYKARNLSFKSGVYDFSLSLEYYMLNMKKFRFSPYVFAGVGMFIFNPYTNDASGKKQYLRELGTEGEGLPGYPGMYSKSSVEIPFGGGLKYAVTKKIMISGEINYRVTGTDYLDDVSTWYPDKAALDARNPATAKFTYRGDEVGAGPYPTILKLTRGNPGKKDSYYTMQLKVGFKL